MNVGQASDNGGQYRKMTFCENLMFTYIANIKIKGENYSDKPECKYYWTGHVEMIRLVN